MSTSIDRYDYRYEEEDPYKDEKGLGRIKQKLSELYMFRLNAVTKQLEFKNIDSNSFNVLDTTSVNDIIIQLNNEHIYIKKKTLLMILNSSYTTSYNPIVEYFQNLEEWNRSSDYIAELANTIETNDDGLFLLVFRKWLVAMVASIHSENEINPILILNVGNNDLAKRLWVKRLVPIELNNYFYEGTINPSSMNDRALLTKNFLIYITGISEMNEREYEKQKLLLASTRRERAAREKFESPKIASCIASVNLNHYKKNDVDSNKRVFYFEVKLIDHEHKIPIDNVLSQALYLYRDGFAHQFDIEEISLLQEIEINSEVNSISIEKLVEEYLKPSSINEKDFLKSTATETMNLLLEMAEQPRKATSSDAVKLGKILTEKEFKYSMLHGGKKVYHYKIR